MSNIPCDPVDEICNISDSAMTILATMLQTQYRMGFEYACWKTGIDSNTEENLKKILVPLDPKYLRALIKARKGKAQVI